MTTGKDTASFFENGTTHQFEYCYKIYPQVLKVKAEKRSKKPQELIRLDLWYQNELPKLLKERGKDAHMVYDELVQTMKWKQARGKFYPQLSYLVKVNTPRAVMQETKKAFRKLPNLEQAITALSNLKGVGTTMASALLAAAAPHSAPFMADECLMAIPEIEGIDYTTKEYLNFVQHIQSTVKRLNTEAGDENAWSPHRVELALWSHYVANDLSPDLLEEMPGPGSGGGGITNGNSPNKKLQSAKILDGNDDTNDGDDESLRAGVLQDGDSNFVSNDSTSQEPIIDENTTQTTATTSTDDGEAGTTPLASDSESNLEAPTKLNKSSSIATSNSLSNNIISGLESNNIKAPLGNSNGNGNGLIVNDSLDGENSSHMRSSANDDVSESDEDENERNIDESSNSNNSGADQKSTSNILNLNNTANINTDNDSTLSSSAGITITQKRSLHCVGNIINEDANSQQPELKKVRSE